MAVIAIDLGTANTRVAVWQNGAAKNLKNELGNRITPSCVAFNNHERFIGDAAKNQMAMNPPNTVYDVKRLMGRMFTDSQVQVDQQKWPFQLSQRPNNYPKIDLSIFGEPKSLLPEEVTAMILASVKNEAENSLKRCVTAAVITVPTVYGSSQRQAILDAAHIAGLTVQCLLNETTAAALAYGMEFAVKGKQVVLFYHLGAGAFDVAIVEITDGRQFDVLGVEGNSCLGGIDFDDRLVQYFADEFERQNDIAIRNNARAMRRLRTACESVKKILSTNSEAVIEVDSLCDGLDFSSTITRAKFESISKDLYAETFDSVIKLLAKLKMDKSKIDEVFLIGGSTRIPKIAKWHADYFGAGKMNCTMNAEEIVVTGAAVRLAMLTEPYNQAMVVNDIVSLPFFVTGKKNEPLPLAIGLHQTVACRFQSGYETSLYVNIFETGNSCFFGDWYTIQDILAAPMSEMTFNFNIDGNGVFTFTSAKLDKSWYDLQPSITKYTNRISDHEMDYAIRNSNIFAEIDCENNRKKKARVQYEHSILSFERNLMDNELDKSKTTQLREYVATELEWLRDNVYAPLDVFQERHLLLNAQFEKKCAKQEFIQSLDSIRSDAQNLPEHLRTKMCYYLDKSRKWIEFQDGESAENAIKERTSELLKRFQDFNAEHRRSEEHVFEHTIRSLQEQIAELSQTYGDDATIEFGQLCKSEMAWLSSSPTNTPATLRMRSDEFVVKREAILTKLKQRRDRAQTELMDACHAARKSKVVRQARTRSSKKLANNLLSISEENLKWLQKNKDRASIQELTQRKEHLTGLIMENELPKYGKVPILIDMFENISMKNTNKP